jgi:hypothetical protein
VVPSVRVREGNAMNIIAIDLAKVREVLFPE